MTFTQMQGVRFRAYPTPQMAQTLSQWNGCARVIYNCKVHEDREVFKSGQQLPITQQYSHFKTEDRTLLKEVPSQVLRNSACRFKEAYQRFFKGLAQRPNFKKKGQRDSVWLTKELFRFIDGKLILGTRKHPIGELPFHAHRPYQHPASIPSASRQVAGLSASLMSRRSLGLYEPKKNCPMNCRGWAKRHCNNWPGAGIEV